MDRIGSFRENIKLCFGEIDKPKESYVFVYIMHIKETNVEVFPLP